MEIKLAGKLFPEDIISKVKSISISTHDTHDETTWNFPHDGMFSIKRLHGQTITLLIPILKQKFLMDFSELEFFSRIKHFAWRLIRGKVTTRDFVTKFNTNIVGNCPFCNLYRRYQPYFKQCYFCVDKWSKISYDCHPLFSRRWIFWIGLRTLRIREYLQ